MRRGGIGDDGPNIKAFQYVTPLARALLWEIDMHRSVRTWASHSMSKTNTQTMERI